MIDNKYLDELNDCYVITIDGRQMYDLKTWEYVCNIPDATDEINYLVFG